MKKITAILLVLTGVSFLSKAQSKFDKWPELKNFHTIMSQTFHPSEEGDLDPIKKRCGELVEKAELLSKSQIPQEFNNKAVKEAVAKLVADGKKLQKMIADKASDEAIKKALSELHDTFHTIVERCDGKDEHH